MNLEFGAMAPRISEQLEDQGFSFNADDAAKWQRHLESINRLRIHGLLADSESHKAYKRLIKMIAKGVIHE